jgi:uncharacterized membrane protein YcgQ (UPF0703/DUF1980 family)
MKRTRAAALLAPAALCAALLTACGGTSGAAAPPAKTNGAGTLSVDVADDAIFEEDEGEEGDEGIFDIRERLFVSQINDIYLNAEDYLGRTLRFEGIFNADYEPETDKEYYYVVRYGPGCCGTDANPGFEIDGDVSAARPDDWVEAVGVLEVYEEDGYQYLRVRLDSLRVMEERGNEFVS